MEWLDPGTNMFLGSWQKPGNPITLYVHLSDNECDNGEREDSFRQFPDRFSLMTMCLMSVKNLADSPLLRNILVTGSGENSPEKKVLYG